MKILYVHGLESGPLPDDKRIPLELLGFTIISPDINYFNGDVLPMLKKIVDTEHPDFIVGSSIGGRVGYYLSNVTKVPALLFNPALDSPQSNELQPIPKFVQDVPKFENQFFVFGGNDDVVYPESTLDFLEHELDFWNDYKLIDSMAHRVPVDVLIDCIKTFSERV